MGSLRRDVILFSVFFSFSFLIHGSLLSGGYIINADFTRVNTISSFINEIIPLWNEYGSHASISILSKFLIYTPLILFDFLKLGIEITYIYLIYFSILSAISALFVFKLSKYVISQNNYKLSTWEEAFCISSAFFYIFSTYVVEQVTHPAIKYGFYLAPLILYTLIKGINENRKRYLVLSAILWSLAVADLHWSIFGSIIIVGYIAHDLIYKVSKDKKPKIYLMGSALTSIIVVFGTFLLINLYWIIPGVLSGGSSLYPNVLTEEGLISLFRNANMPNVMAMKGNFFLTLRYGDLPQFLDSLQGINLNIFLIALVIIGLSSLVMYKDKSKEHIFFGLLFIVSVFLSAGPRFLPQLFNWFMFGAPFHSIYAWAFRTPKFHQFLILALAPLIALTGIQMNRFLESKKKEIGKIFPLIFLVIIILCSIIPNYPLLTGDFNGNLKTTDLPDDYKATINYLDKSSEDVKVIWGPPYAGLNSSWWGNRIKRLTEDITPKPTYNNPTFNDNLKYPVLFGIRHPYDSIVYRNETNHVSMFFSPLNVKYIIVHNDIQQINTKTNKILKNLQYQKNLKHVKNYGFADIFELENVSIHISVKSKNILLQGGLKGYNSLTSIESINPNKIGVIYQDQNLNSNFINFSDIIIDNKINGIDLRNAIILTPFEYTNHFDPDNMWSKTFVTSVLFRYWLLKFRLHDPYQLNYGKGLVFTWATKEIAENIIPTKNDLIVTWNFDNKEQLNEWKNVTPEKQFNATQKLKRENNALKSELYNSTWGWKTINSPLIPTEFGNTYAFGLKTKGENAHEVFIKIFEYNDKNKRIGGGKQFFYSVERGTFDWKEANFILYTLQNESTKYLQLQVWHGHKTDKTLPNIVWIDDVKVYDITKYTEPVTLKMPFKVDENDTYKLFIRYFKNQEGGEIKVYLDGRPIEITTKDQLNKFVWKELAISHLSKGKHTLVLENVEGFDAINLFALIPEKEYEQSKEEVTKILQNKTLIYLFEAESDLYRENAEISKEFGGEASNGEVLAMADGKAWQEIELIKNGTYSLAIRAKGDFQVQIDDKEFEFHNSNLTYWYSTIFELNEGKYNLTITPLDIPIANFSFEPVSSNIENGIIEELPQGIVSFSNDSFGGNSSLKINLIVSEGRIWFRTTDVNVKSGEGYWVITHMKYENVVESYISIEGYNETSGEWIELGQIPSRQDGTSDWKEYKQILTIPEDITKIGFVLNAGWIKALGEGNATTWFDDIRIYPVKDYLDVAWLYSTKNSNETLNELFKTNETPAVVINYTKINPTKYEVKVNASKPFMLSFAESYDPLWEARVYKADKKSEVVKSIPLYSVINGFWIDETGDLEVEIRYKPQDWFVLGLWISGMTFFGCVGYLFYDWRRGRGDKWALRFGARAHNVGSVVNKGLKEGVRRLKRKN